MQDAEVPFPAAVPLPLEEGLEEVIVTGKWPVVCIAGKEFVYSKQPTWLAPLACHPVTESLSLESC